MTPDPIETEVPARYLSALGLGLVVLLGGVGALDAVIDPSGVYDLGLAPGLDAHRSDLGSRTAKADALLQQGWEVLLFGTSRTAIGFDPAAEVWGGARVLNLGLRGSNIVETEQLLSLALQHQRPDEIWFVVDLFMFGDGRRTGADHGRSLLNAEQDRLAYHADKLLGLPSLLDTVRTLRNAATGRDGGYSPEGFRLYQRVASEPPRTAALRWLERFVVNPSTYAPFRYDPERMASFAGMLERAEASGARVVVVVAPHHAMLLELQHQLGLSDSAERFRRELAQLGAQHAIYDATGYVGAPGEPLPSDAGGELAWYWEVSHFRNTLGQLLVQQIHDDRLDDPRLPVARLTPQTIDARLGELAQQRLRWREDSAADAQVVEALVDCVQRLRDAGDPVQIEVFGALGNPGCAAGL